MIVLDPSAVKCNTSSMDSLAKNMTIEHAKPMEEQFLFKIE
jgi:hypothetical protein